MGWGGLVDGKHAVLPQSAEPRVPTDARYPEIVVLLDAGLSLLGTLFTSVSPASRPRQQYHPCAERCKRVQGRERSLFAPGGKAHLRPDPPHVSSWLLQGPVTYSHELRHGLCGGDGDVANVVRTDGISLG